MNNLIGDVKANPREFYRYINSQKKDTQGIPPLKTTPEKGEWKECCSVGPQKGRGIQWPVYGCVQVPLLDRSAPFMNNIAVSKDEVIKLLKGLNPSKL